MTLGTGQRGGHWRMFDSSSSRSATPIATNILRRLSGTSEANNRGLRAKTSALR
jgi:hypothetical protein